jgi:hypothetical protein
MERKDDSKKSTFDAAKIVWQGELNMKAKLNSF